MKPVLNTVLESRRRVHTLPLAARWALFTASYVVLTGGGVSLFARLLLG